MATLKSDAKILEILTSLSKQRGFVFETCFYFLKTKTNQIKNQEMAQELINKIEYPKEFNMMSPPILRYGPSPYQDEMGRETIDWHDLYHRVEKSNNQELKKSFFGVEQFDQVCILLYVTSSK